MLLNIIEIFTIIFFCFVAYILFAPLILDIDSRSDIYMFRIAPFFRIRWVTDDPPGHLEMSVFGIQKKLSLSFSKKEVKEVKEIKAKKSSAFKFNPDRLISVIRSFRIKKCFVNIDTGNMPLNGELFPMMYLLSGITGQTFRINFTGKTEVVLTIKNNAFRILKAFINNN